VTAIYEKEIHSRKFRSHLRVDERVSLEEQIAQRAQELWQERGREHGHDLTDWLRAEREINEWHQKKLRGGNSTTPTEKALILMNVAQKPTGVTFRPLASIPGQQEFCLRWRNCKGRRMENETRRARRRSIICIANV